MHMQAVILGAAGVLLIAGALALGRGRELLGLKLSVIGLVIALTAGALISLYVEQISAITSALTHVALLFGVLHYRNRFLRLTAAAGMAAAEARA